MAKEIHDRIALLVGDLALSGFEDQLSQTWPDCLDGKPRAFRVQSALHRLLRDAATQRGAQLVLIDVGPNLGAINRAALIASDHVAVPLAPDLFSLQGLHNLGPTLRRWRGEWRKRLHERPTDLDLPTGSMTPAGYIVLQHAVRLDRPVKAYQRWAQRIPAAYRDDVLQQQGSAPTDASDDPNCLAMLKHYRSLMPLAQDANKPVFHLLAADGALGAHAQAVKQAGEDFRRLARRIADAIGVALPTRT
jgi:chromosome partitioning protein